MEWKRGDDKKLQQIRNHLMRLENENIPIVLFMSFTERHLVLANYIQKEGMLSHDHKFTIKGKTDIMRLIEHVNELFN